MNIRFANFNIFNGHPKPEEPAPSKDMAATRDRQKVFESIQARLDERRSFGEKFADGLVKWSGNMYFVLFHLFFFAFWVMMNLGEIAGIKPFDPFPFILLTMIVSLEAIFLSLFVLISQNRESKVSDLREEIDLQINMIAEQEITKIIHLLAYIMKHLNIQYERDPELKRMMKPLDTEEIRQELERQLKLPHQK